MVAEKTPDNSQDLVSQSDQVRDAHSKIEDIKSASNDKGVGDRLIAFVLEQSRINWFWILAYSVDILYFLYALISSPPGSDVPVLPVIIFTCIIFVQIFAEQVDPIPDEGASQKEKRRLEEKKARQRYKWMIFAYSFMLMSLVLTIYPFIKPFLGTSHENIEMLRDRPIVVLIGCSSDSKSKSLSCSRLETETGADGKVKTKEMPSVGAWVINIGGYIKECTKNENEYGKSLNCKVSDGLLVPLYFIILALMGGSISLTRRLPELQKQASKGHIATERQPKLTQHEFREHLIFQIVQFISAPFLAILAYYLIEPSNTTNSVALAFTAGFASETILLMIRSIANKITPETSTLPQYGAVAGVITLGEKNEQLAEKAEVFLSESPQIRSITDERGFYILGNVPVGEHSISIKSINKEEILKKDTVKIDRAQAIVKKNVTIIVQKSQQSQDNVSLPEQNS